MFCFRVTTTEILFDQFLYPRYREFVEIIFVILVTPEKTK